MLAAAVAEAERACYRGGAQSPDLHVRSAQVYALARSSGCFTLRRAVFHR